MERGGLLYIVSQMAVLQREPPKCKVTGRAWEGRLYFRQRTPVYSAVVVVFRLSLHPRGEESGTQFMTGQWKSPFRGTSLGTQQPPASSPGGFGSLHLSRG